MKEIITLDRLSTGERARLVDFALDEAMKHRLFDLGFVRGTFVECVGKSPMGDPSAYLVRGAVIAIRASDARGLIAERGDDDGAY